MKADKIVDKVVDLMAQVPHHCLRSFWILDEVVAMLSWYKMNT
jgi:hypothetical protein